MKQGESVKLKGSARKAKKKLRDHHQSCYSPRLLALLATNSLELKLAQTAINENIH